MKQLLINMDEETKKRIRMGAAEQDMSMSKFVSAVIEFFLGMNVGFKEDVVQNKDALLKYLEDYEQGECVRSKED